MATPDRSTLALVFAALAARFKSELVANPPTPTKPLRRIEFGDAVDSVGPRPVLALGLERIRPVAAVDGDKMFEVVITVTLAVDAITTDWIGPGCIPFPVALLKNYSYPSCV